MGGWKLRVLGANTLAGEAGSFGPDRKTSGLLVHLALEGPTSRRRLAGLFWPDVEESRARNSLARVLSRLRQASYRWIVVGDEVLQLDEALEVDARQLQVHAFRGEAADVLELAGELLPHFEYDDISEFEAWLRGARGNIAELIAQALHTRIRELEADGLFEAALRLAGRLIAQDPLLESSHRLAMQLHYRNGDRAAALRVFADCRAVLQNEWGVEPDEETLALAASIERGDLERAVVPVRAESAPKLSVADPSPMLVGREREWALLEEGWQKGHAILVHGPPGVGKSRLLQEFAASKGTVLVTGGRPGDSAIPYASLARSLRRAITAAPDMVIAPWVRTELGRLLPELAAESALPVADSPLRFDEALYELYCAVLGKFDVVVVDDLQFYDASSFEAASRFVNRRPAEGVQARTIGAFRTDEIPPSYLRHTEDLVDRDLHTLVEIKPLAPEATGALLEQVVADAGPLGHLSGDLHRYTGGNPLFILETVRLLQEREQLGESFPERLPPAGKVGAVIRQRLTRLSPEALRVAQTASILKSDFNLEIIAAVLETSAVSLLAPWRELELAGFVQDNRFSHDLIFETVDETVSQPVRVVLNSSVAGVLTARGASAGRIARHWLAAGNGRAALDSLFRAAKHAETAYRVIEALEFYRLARKIAESLGDEGARFEAALGEARILLQDASPEKAEAIVARCMLAAGNERERDQVLEAAGLAEAPTPGGLAGRP